MESHSAFKTIKTSEYGLCHFYQVGMSGNFSEFPEPCLQEVGDWPRQKLSFCPFCQYSGSNDQSYLNHIMCAHYCANYGCGKCLDAVFTSRQRLSRHMKKCKGLTTDWERGTIPQACERGVHHLRELKEKEETQE